ncbi:hypothetical protein PTKIN_Ptkin13bG0228600 [Pterospermum kingtungense]
MEQTRESKSKGKAVVVASSEAKLELKGPFPSAAFNKPLSPDDMLELIPPAYHQAESHPRRFMRPGKEPIRANSIEEVNSCDNPPKNLEGDQDFMRHIFKKNPQYHPYEMILPEHTDDNFDMIDQPPITMDLLSEWMPIYGFADDAQPGTSSGKGSEPIPRNYPKEEEVCRGPTTSTVECLDLELKLGFQVKIGLQPMGLSVSSTVVIFVSG